MRLALSSFLAIFVSLSIFFAMEMMTSPNNMEQVVKKDTPQLVYLRDKKDSQIKEKKRVEPKKPKQEKPEKIEFKKPKMKMNIEKNVKIEPIISKNINLSSLSLSGSLVNVNVGLIDANTLMTLSRIYPKYPRRAKLQRKEGYVQLQFKIDSNGYVKSPKIIKAEPVGLFEDSALNAIKRWRFKPVKGADPSSFIDATITFNYRLSK